MADNDVQKILSESQDYKIFNNNRHINELTHYNLLRIGAPSTGLGVKGIPVAFITTPLLNINSINVKQNDFFAYLSANNPYVLNSLNYQGYGSGDFNDGQGTIYKNGNILHKTTSPFIKLLTNRFVSIDIKDTQMETKDMGQTFYGFKQRLPTTYINTVNGDDFSMTFQETKDIKILQIFKAWVEYIEAVGRGTMISSPRARLEKVLDYTASVYYFVLDLDGTTILSYHRYTGVVPLNVPYSSMQKAVGDATDPIQIPINFSYSYKEDMNPHILSDFNMVMADPKHGVSQQLTTGNSISSALMSEDLSFMGLGESSKDISQTAVDPIEQFDLSNANAAQVVLENYNGSGEDKYRFKLKMYAEPNIIANNDSLNKSKDSTNIGIYDTNINNFESGTTFPNSKSRDGVYKR